MNTPTHTEEARPGLVPDDDLTLDRLYRVPAALYQGLVARGLVDPAVVALRDGYLVRRERAGGDRLYRMPLEVYERVAELGLLGPDDRTELFDGLLVAKMTRYPPHILSTKLLVEALRAVLPQGWHLGKEDAIVLPSGPSGQASVPEPDVAVIRGGIRDYATRLPGPDDLALVVEVAESSLRDDRAKLGRYAWAGIPAAWIVNLMDRRIEVYTVPSGPSPTPGYQEGRAYGPGERVPVVLDGQEHGPIVVDEVLPAIP